MTEKAARFIEALAELRFDNCFNPYADTCPEFDAVDAPAIRRANLLHVLTAAAKTGVEDLWIGLELGYNGGRRTGLAMTDEAHLLAHGRRFGVSDRLQVATRAGPAREMTAGIVWEALGEMTRQVFLWNVVPFHPHRPGEPVSNRRHSTKEREACLPHLAALIEMLSPRRLVSIGREASTALSRQGYRHIAVRHPAFGGKRDFLERVARIA